MTNYRFLVSIPTYNAADTLAGTLQSIKRQTYQPAGCNIVDGQSTDTTVAIAQAHQVSVKRSEGRLLKARYAGLAGEDFDYVVMIDADQILEPRLLERLNRLLNQEHPDMVILEEFSYRPRTWVERMFALDRQTVHRDRNVSAERGVIMPRVFSRRLITAAFRAVKRTLSAKAFDEVLAHDHSILFYEARLRSDRLGYLDRAVFHREPKTLSSVFHHFARWGRSDYEDRQTPYGRLLRLKMAGRRRDYLRRFSWTKLRTFPLLLTKWLGYYYGARIKR